MSDWVLVVASAAFVLVGWFLGSALYGALASALVALDAGALGPGALAGLYLPFIGLGATTGAAATVGDSQVAVGGQYLPVLFLALMLLLPWKVLDFARSRMAPLPGAQLAFVFKLAVILGLAIGIIAGIISFGSFDSFGEADTVAAEVSSSSAGLLALFFVALTGLVHAVRRRALAVPERLRVALASPQIAVMRDGAIAFVLFALAGAVLSLLGALVVADSTEARIASVVTLPLTAGNVGTAFAVIGSGASVATIDSHLSLFHFGLPPVEGADAVLPPVFAVLVAGPGLVGWMVLRRLGTIRPQDDRTIMGIGFLAGLGYALAMWLAALFLAIRVSGSVFDGDAFGGTGLTLFAAPSVAASFGLALLLGIAGGIGAAFYWSQANGVRWFSVAGQSGEVPTTASAQPTPPPPPPPPPRPTGDHPPPPPSPRRDDEP